MSQETILPPMKFKIDQLVEFQTADGKQSGRIRVADWGGSIEHDYHSYDVYVHENNLQCKHISESKISPIDSLRNGHSNWREGQRVGFETFNEDTSEWISQAGSIVAKHWDEEIEEFVYDIEVIIDYDTSEKKLFERVFFEYLMARF